MPSKNARKQREPENLKLNKKKKAIEDIVEFCKINN